MNTNPEPLTAEQEAWIKRQTQNMKCRDCEERKPCCQRRTDPIEQELFGRQTRITLCDECYKERCNEA